MLRPMIHAPTHSPARLARSLSGPVVPPVLPSISRNARVTTNQPCSSSPPTPRGFSRVWRGPAPYPSSEIAKLWTRSLDTESSVGCICVEWAVLKSTGEGFRSLEPPRRRSRGAACCAPTGWSRSDKDVLVLRVSNWQPFPTIAHHELETRDPGRDRDK